MLFGLKSFTQNTFLYVLGACFGGNFEKDCLIYSYSAKWAFLHIMKADFFCDLSDVSFNFLK